MKNINGKIELEENEVRVNNFVIAKEEKEQYISIQDINQQIYCRISTNIPKGQILDINLQDYLNGDCNADYLEYVVVTTFYFLSTVPDRPFFEQLIRSLNECNERLAAMYGTDKNLSQKENDKILQEMKEYYQKEEEEKTGTA